MAVNTTLTAGQDWTIRARLQAEGYGFAQAVQGVKLDVTQADIARVLDTHVGAVTNLRVNVFRSWFASDTVDITFTITPRASIDTGDVSRLALGDPIFTPEHSLGYWIWYAANLSVYAGNAFQPFVDNTVGILPSDSLVVDEVKRGKENLSTSSSTSSVGGLFRSLNTVRSTDPEQDGRLSVSVQAGEALKKASSWEVIPSWVQVLLTVLPIGIVVIGTVIIGRQVYGLVKGVTS